MTVFISLAVAGLLLGRFFNVYALAAACLLLAAAPFLFLLSGAAAPTLGQFASGLCFLQIGYGVGLLSWALPKPAKNGAMTTSEF